MFEKLKSLGKKKPKQQPEEYFAQGNDYLDEMEDMQNNLNQDEFDYQHREIDGRSSRTSRSDKPKRTKKPKEKTAKRFNLKKSNPPAVEDSEENELVEEKPKISFKEKLKQKPQRSKKRKKSKIIKRDRISIDIGSKYIKIVEGMYDGKVVSVKNLITVPTPENSYLDGDITDFAALRMALDDAIARAGIASKEVIYTMESKSIISREVELPSVIEKDIKQMMEYQVEEYFPVNLNEYVMQSKVVEEIDTDEKKESKISVSILPKVMCEEYLRLTDSLELKPIALDMNDNSIYKLLSESFNSTGNEEGLKNKTIATLDIGHNITNISVIEDGKFRFSRLIEVGGRDINRNIEQRLNIPEDEVERIKLNIGSILSEDVDPEEEQDNTQLESIKSVIQGSLSELCQEVERIFRYHTGRSSGNQINEIYIYGATSRMIDIEKYIENVLNIPTYKISNLDNVRLVKKYRDMDITQYANAIGAIIRM